MLPIVPLWAQTIGSMLPVTYFIRIVRGILLKGSGLQEIWPNLWPRVCRSCFGY